MENAHKMGMRGICRPRSITPLNQALSSCSGIGGCCCIQKQSEPPA